MKKSKKGLQEKECNFINCSLSLGTQLIELADKQKINMPVINITNDDYDDVAKLKRTVVYKGSNQVSFKCVI